MPVRAYLGKHQALWMLEMRMLLRTMETSDAGQVFVRESLLVVDGLWWEE